MMRSYRPASEGDIIMKLKRRSMWSPDANFISRFDNFLILVTGRLKKSDQKNGLYLSGAKYLGRGRTMESKYVMRRVSPDYPIVLERPRAVQSCHIQGDVFAVSFSQLMRLDVFESNMNLTERELVYVQMLDQSIPLKQNNLQNPVVNCYMYVGKDEVWSASEDTYRFGTRMVQGNKTSFIHDPVEAFVG